MSDYEKKDNEGVLFKNDKKLTENHPEYKGNIRVGGKDYWLSAWVNKSSKGTMYMSVKTTPQDDQQKAAPAPAAVVEDDLNDDLPF